LRNFNTFRNHLLPACLAAAFFVESAYAIDPNRSLSQYVLDKWGPEHGLPSGPVYALAQTSDGYLWAGAEGGLVRFDGLTFDNSNLAGPGVTRRVLGLAAAPQNGRWLWITTESHVLRVNRERLKHSSARDPLGPEDFREYQPGDGLRSLEGVKRHRSVVADSHGRIWFSMSRGLSVVDTVRLRERSVPALVHIQAISADGNPLGMNGPVQVPAGTQRITLGYAGLSLSMPERTRFRYTLEGGGPWLERTRRGSPGNLL
jgi:ligand-binding sensor domain-containing protein